MVFPGIHLLLSISSESCYWRNAKPRYKRDAPSCSSIWKRRLTRSWKRSPPPSLTSVPSSLVLSRGPSTRIKSPIPAPEFFFHHRPGNPTAFISTVVDDVESAFVVLYQKYIAQLGLKSFRVVGRSVCQQEEPNCIEVKANEFKTLVLGLL